MSRRRRPGNARQSADRARRHAEQGQARRERDPRRLARSGEGGRRGGGHLALPLSRRRGCSHAARPDAERDQRRRACAELDRPAGVHARSGGGLELCGGRSDRLGGLPLAPRASPRTWLCDGGRGRRGVRTRSRVERAGDRGRARGRRASRPARERRDRTRSGRDGGLARGRVPVRGTRARARWRRTSGGPGPS